MGYSAPVVNGELQQTSASGNSLSQKKVKSGSSMDKDAFLQLLVAQMKYQDPLEPTSNTEYISQLATFSELEEMQNMTTGMSMQRASALVGEEVILNVTNKVTGENQFIRGKVDFVQMEGGKAYLSIGGDLYSIDDLYNVVDTDYLTAYDKATKLLEKLAELPKVINCTLDNREDIEEISKIYNEMSDYEKSFVAEDMKKMIQEYEKKLLELRTLAGETGKEKNEEILKKLEKLPKVEECTLEHKKAIEEILKTYNGMNEKEKAFVAKETQELLKAYEEKLKALQGEEKK